MTENQTNQTISPNQTDQNNNKFKLFCSVCFRFGNKEREECYGHRPGKDCPTLAEYECPNCNEKGHTRRHCSQERVFSCRYCKEEGHKIQDCPILKQKEERKEKIKNTICNFCGESGHSQRFCRSPYNVSNR